MKKLVIPLLFISFSAGADDWLCKEESSQRVENVIKACGIGTGKDENTARLKAFDNAKLEFTKVCQLSDDCKGHTISVIPQRTACEQKDGKFKCYRLLGFVIGDSIGPNVKSGGKTKKSNVSLKDAPDHFEPFSVDELSNYPRIKKGMSKAEVMNLFGEPKNTGHNSFDKDSLDLIYAGKMCVVRHAFSDKEATEEYNPCKVRFYKGKVRQVEDFRPVYNGVDVE